MFVLLPVEDEIRILRLISCIMCSGGLCVFCKFTKMSF